MPRSKPDPALAATVRRLREGRGLTREDLAFEAGIAVGSLARLELGNGSPSWDTLGRVAAALGLPVSGLADAVEDERRRLGRCLGTDWSKKLKPMPSAASLSVPKR